MNPTTAPQPQPLREAWQRSTIPGRIALLAAAACAIAMAKPAYHVVESLLLPSPGQFTQSQVDKTRIESHASAFDGFVAQLNGRSLFWTPSKPGTDATVVVEEDPAEGETSAPPARYDGPAIMAIVLDTVWFADGKKLTMTDDEKDGIKVISTNAPWEAVLRYRGKEFTVPFFERDKVVFKDKIAE
jgi:hypothetical protein